MKQRPEPSIAEALACAFEAYTLETGGHLVTVTIPAEHWDSPTPKQQASTNSWCLRNRRTA